MSRPKRGDNGVGDLARSIEHLAVGKADQEITTRLQYGGALDIPELRLFIIVNTAIKLDNQSGLHAHEIGDEAVYGDLAAELGVRQAAATNEMP